MPVAYMKILETEARLMGLRRGAFLNLLLRRKLDGVRFERAPGAPEYRFTEAEFTEWKPWTWYMAPLDRVRLEIDKNTDWRTTAVNNSRRSAEERNSQPPR